MTLESGLFFGMVYHSEWKTGYQLGPVRHISTQNFLEYFPRVQQGLFVVFGSVFSLYLY